MASAIRAVATATIWRPLYVDLSVFTNLGVTIFPKGGAVRAAPGRIVNILGGGGLAPLLRADVLEALLGTESAAAQVS